MAVYIRADKRKNKTYYWLVESHREANKVVQRRIKSLGTEPPTGKRLEEIQQIVEDFKKKLNATNKPPIKKQRRNFKRREK